MPDVYRFRPLAIADLPAVKRWLSMPHVAAWWGNPDEQFSLVSADLNHAGMEQFIVAIENRPFAYLQSFELKEWPDAAFGSQPDGTRSIDLFIGEPDMIGRGHGPAFIREFVADLFASGAPRVITDPHPDNLRAIRASEKAGFRKVRVVAAREGPALLMVRDP